MKPVGEVDPLPLSDAELRRLWRSVQGPRAELNGPLIRFAGLVLKAALPVRSPRAEKACIEELLAFIEREGYRRCDVPACHCHSFHGGHAMARLNEIEDALLDVGIDLNGKTILTGVRELAARAASRKET